jgi:hypothetical protein
LLLLQAKKIDASSLLAFFVPLGQNASVRKFAAAALPVTLKRQGFTPVARDATYATYLSIIQAVAPNIDKSILEVEMFLFAQANELCEEALALVRA